MSSSNNTVQGIVIEYTSRMVLKHWYSGQPKHGIGFPCLCTKAFQAEVGQQYVGKGNEVQVSNYPSPATYLVAAQSKILLQLLDQNFDVPSLHMFYYHLTRRETNLVCDQAYDVSIFLAATEHDLNLSYAVHSSDSFRHSICLHAGFRAQTYFFRGPSHYILSVLTNLPLDATHVKIPIALGYRNIMPPALPARPHYASAQVERIEQNHYPKLLGYIQGTDSFGRKLGKLAERHRPSRSLHLVAILLLGVKRQSPWNRYASKTQCSHNHRMALHEAFQYVVVELAHRRHDLSPLGVSCVVKNKVQRLSLSWSHGLKHSPCRFVQDLRFVPARAFQERSDPRPMPSPTLLAGNARQVRLAHTHAQVQQKRPEMEPCPLRKLLSERAEKEVQFLRYPSDKNHKASPDRMFFQTNLSDQEVLFFLWLSKN